MTRLSTGRRGRIRIDIDGLSEAELVDSNRRIVERLLAQVRAHG